MFSKLADLIPLKTNDMAREILYGVCEKAGFNPADTTDGIYQFWLICRHLSRALKSGLDYDAYIKLDLNTQVKIKEQIITSIYDFISNNDHMPRYRYYDSKIKYSVIFDGIYIEISDRKRVKLDSPKYFTNVCGSYRKKL